MRFVIVTGMSGAGKSTALKMLEDVGYYCIDNLPIPLVPKLGELLSTPFSEVNKIALGLDIRSVSSSSAMMEALENLKKGGVRFEVLFLEASDSVLIKRYKETRRNHPLAGDGRIDIGIQKEREELKGLKNSSDYIVDTSRLLTRELKKELNEIFVENKEYKNLYITVLSFGFKYGIPNDADLVFDVRFLPNPYYIEELRPKNGNDKEVQDYVMSNGKAACFMEKLSDMIRFLVPNYIAEGKSQLVIAVGCTGGKHRSVTLANALYRELDQQKEGYGLKLEHRDIEKDSITKAK